jgi:hypothetical protein
MDHQVDHGNEDHRLAALGQGLVVLGESAVLSEPGKGAFDDPSFGQHDEPMQQGTLDDLDNASVPAAGPVDEAPGIAAVGEDQLQTPKTCSQLPDQQFPTIAVLNVGRVHHQRHDQAEGVDDQMTLAPKDFLARVVPTIPPFSAVLTDWLSRIPTLGVGFLPAF